MKDRERMKSAERIKGEKTVLILLALFIAIVMICTGITKTVTKYMDICKQFYNMHDNIRAADVYMSKNESLTDNVYIWDEICLYPEDAILFLNDLCESNGMEIKKMRFYHEVDTESDVSVLMSEIELECTYELLLGFMDDIKNEGGNVAVDSVNVLELGGGKINAVTKLNFYLLN